MPEEVAEFERTKMYMTHESFGELIPYMKHDGAYIVRLPNLYMSVPLCS